MLMKIVFVVLLLAILADGVVCLQFHDGGGGGNGHFPHRINSIYSKRARRNSTSSSHAEVKNEDLLMRINERLTSLMTLDEQQLKRLETLEYKMTRIEVTQQERSETIRDEVREISRRIQNIDWLMAKTDGAIEQLKNEFEGVRQLLDGSAPAGRTDGYYLGVSKDVAGAGGRSGISSAVMEKLNALSVLITSTRTAVQRVEKDVAEALAANVSVLMDAARETQQALRTVPTKQFLNNALLGLKSQPIYAVMQGGRGAVGGQGGEGFVWPASCKEVGTNVSGVYKIQPSGLARPFYAYCDADEAGGGWTVIQNRIDGSLTSDSIHELLIVLEDFDGDRVRARYTAFAIGSEREHFSLNLLGKYSGDAGDSFTYQAGQKFSTFDLDNDAWTEGNCAQAHQGGWWYNACDMSNLNGRYLNGDVPSEQQYQGIYWNEFRGSHYSLKRAKMLIRAIN